MLRLTRVMLFVSGFLALVPALAHAQASIAGVVRDASGAVLPGVTVEASSPALIEKVRSVTTDGSGQYRITELRPGTYTVTYALSGFSTVRREGIELTGTFVATIDVDLRVAGRGAYTWKGKIVRIAHLGYVGTFDVVTGLAALELALHHFGASVEFGRGVGAAQAILREGLPPR